MHLRTYDLSPKIGKIFGLMLCAVSLALTVGCSSAKTFAFSCSERQIEIYVNDEYLGRDLVYYTVPKGVKDIKVSCREDGVEVYNRNINVEHRSGNLIELQIPKHYKY